MPPPGQPARAKLPCDAALLHSRALTPAALSGTATPLGETAGSRMLFPNFALRWLAYRRAGAPGEGEPAGCKRACAGPSPHPSATFPGALPGSWHGRLGSLGLRHWCTFRVALLRFPGRRPGRPQGNWSRSDERSTIRSGAQNQPSQTPCQHNPDRLSTRNAPAPAPHSQTRQRTQQQHSSSSNAD